MIQVTKVARWAVFIVGLGGLPLSATPARAQERRERLGPLRVHPQNPRYFADGSGRAVYLTGSHTWANLQDQGPKDPPKPFDYEPLSRLPARAEPQLHPPLGLGAGALGTLVRRQGAEPLRLVHPARTRTPAPGRARRSTASRSSTWRSGTTRTSSGSARGCGRRASGGSTSR